MRVNQSYSSFKNIVMPTLAIIEKCKFERTIFVSVFLANQDIALDCSLNCYSAFLGFFLQDGTWYVYHDCILHQYPLLRSLRSRLPIQWILQGEYNLCEIRIVDIINLSCMVDRIWPTVGHHLRRPGLSDTFLQRSLRIFLNFDGNCGPI